MSAVLLVASLLLVAAGLAKVVSPDDTWRALRRAGLPVGSGPWTVRAGALVEVVAGVAAIAVDGPVPGLVVAASYAAFAVFVAVALERGWALATCGCFGEPDSPPTAIHVVVDTALAVGAALAAADGVAPASLVVDHPARGLALSAMACVTAGLIYLVLARLPQVRSAATPGRGGLR